MLEVKYNMRNKVYDVSSSFFSYKLTASDCTLLRASEELGEKIWSNTSAILDSWKFLKHEYSTKELPAIKENLKKFVPSYSDDTFPIAHFHFLVRYLPDEHYSVDCWDDIEEFILPAMAKPSLLLSVELTASNDDAKTSIMILPEKSCKLEIMTNDHSYIFAYGADLTNLSPMRDWVISSTIGAVLDKTGKMLFGGKVVD